MAKRQTNSEKMSHELVEWLIKDFDKRLKNEGLGKEELYKVVAKDTAVSFETMGMFTASLPEFILSIYEAKRFIKRIGERVIITQWGRNTFEAYA